MLPKRYRLSRGVWSEYRSGLRVIPLPRLARVVEDRFPRDARAREGHLAEARRLHSAAVASPAALPPPRTASPSRPIGRV
ncbi:hypothetical protein [Streptomyces sp. NPDC048606]|uniref:hypothetical protein n=1 Tax=Streptomyces sp. NPDC048606 TaxID=3154726 RepID=UPI00341E5A34